VVVGAVVVDVVVDVVGDGAAVVVVVVDGGVADGTVEVDADVAAGAASWNGTCPPGPITKTGVPEGTSWKNHSDEFIGMRTQPCEAGKGGTYGSP
jgi:hypothetical protein